MKVLFIISACIIIFGVINYEKMSYRATYFRNKKKYEENDKDNDEKGGE